MAKASTRVVTGCILDSEPNKIYTGGGQTKSFYVSQYYQPAFHNYTQPSEEFSNAYYTVYGNCKYFGSNPSQLGRCTVEGKSYISGDGVQNIGNEVTYTLVDNCAPVTPPMNLPLDDYNWAIILGVGAIGGFVISKKGILV